MLRSGLEFWVLEFSDFRFRDVIVELLLGGLLMLLGFYCLLFGLRLVVPIGFLIALLVYLCLNLRCLGIVYLRCLVACWILVLCVFVLELYLA